MPNYIAKSEGFEMKMWWIEVTMVVLEAEHTVDS